jgi:hypothetical protein
MENLYYSTGQVGRELGVKSNLIRELCDTGMIESVSSNGGHKRIAAGVVEKLRRDGLPDTLRLSSEALLPASTPRRSPFASLETVREDLEGLYVKDQEIHQSIDGLRNIIWYMEQAQDDQPDMRQSAPAPHKRRFSVEARKHIVVAQKKRWAEFLNQKAAAVQETKEPRRKMSTAARRHIAEVQRERWAKFRKQKAAAVLEEKEPPHVMSTAGRKHISRAARKRWAEWQEQKASGTKHSTKTLLGRILEAFKPGKEFRVLDVRKALGLSLVGYVPGLHSTLSRATERGVLVRKSAGLYRRVK